MDQAFKQALLIIDAQQELLDGNETNKPVYQRENLLLSINAVIQQAVDTDSFIIFIRDKDVANGNGRGFGIHQNIHVPFTSKIFDKTATNVFYGTPLLSFLQEHQIKHLIMMGCKTEHCIDTAVRTATISGFDVTLVGDGHSTTDSTILTAEQMINHHNEILHGHYNVDHFSLVRNAHEDLFTPPHNSYR
ncbi:isochorismatase family protein [Brevibacillus laterosporus]|nr:isochorismatase family protein [Brevibacillus laterosporus]TPG68508.1 isochorismatase family protein [Brevibacillus laterosporus]